MEFLISGQPLTNKRQSPLTWDCKQLNNHSIRVENRTNLIILQNPNEPLHKQIAYFDWPGSSGIKVLCNCDPIQQKVNLVYFWEKWYFCIIYCRFIKLSNDIKFVKIEVILFELLQSLYFFLFSLYLAH